MLLTLAAVLNLLSFVAMIVFARTKRDGAAGRGWLIAVLVFMMAATTVRIIDQRYNEKAIQTPGRTAR